MIIKVSTETYDAIIKKHGDPAVFLESVAKQAVLEKLAVEVYYSIKTSDRVQHETMGEGTAYKHGLNIVVIYDKKFNGKTQRGSYGRRWFELCPNKMKKLA